MVHVVGRKANAAKLPSEGLRLNASKSESRPDMINDNIGASLVSRLCYFQVVRFRRLEWCNAMLLDHKLQSETAVVGRQNTICIERDSTKSFVDDLTLGRGDVSVRAGFTLRVAES